MSPTAIFSLLLFSPLMVLLLVPLLFLVPIGVSNMLVALFDPAVGLSQGAAFDCWVFGPIAGTSGFYWIGRGLDAFTRSKYPRRVTLLVIWAVFTAGLFLVLWFDITLLGSISGSDKPIRVYLLSTSVIAAGLTLLAQPLAAPWLGFVTRSVLGVTRPQGLKGS